MASLFSSLPHLLDAGAGHGALTSAVLQRGLLESVKTIHATLYELDSALLDGLHQTIAQSKLQARDSSLDFTASVLNSDFLLATFDPAKPFTHAILNPPYGKLARRTAVRQSLEAAGFDATNLYSAFLDVAIESLAEDG